MCAIWSSQLPLFLEGEEYVVVEGRRRGCSGLAAPSQAREAICYVICAADGLVTAASRRCNFMIGVVLVRAIYLRDSSTALASARSEVSAPSENQE